MVEQPLLGHETGAVARAMALLWTCRTRATIHKLLGLLGYRREDGRPFGLPDVQSALAELKAADLLAPSSEREGLVRLADSLRRPLYAELLAGSMAVDLQRALQELERFRPEEALSHWPLHDREATAALFRLAMFAGTPADKLRQMAAGIEAVMNWPEVLAEAAFAAFDGSLWKRVDPDWQEECLVLALRQLCDSWNASFLEVAEWALGEMESGASPLPEAVRLALAEMLVLQGEEDRVKMVLAGLDTGAADALAAAALVRAGKYPEGQAAFEAAARRRQAEAGARKRLFPAGLAWLYPLALLAQGDPGHLEAARRFCLAEAGERSPDSYQGWGRWVHAIDARLGEAALDPGPFSPGPPRGPSGLDDLWRLLLAAWLGPDLVGMGRDHAPAVVDEAVAALARPLAACRFRWLESQLQGAAAVLQGREPPSPFFIAGRSEAWRQTLAALRALGSREEEESRESRLLWVLQIADDGSLEDIEVLEQRRGPRGWSKPKPASLSGLATDPGLSDQDARVARALRPDRDNPRRFRLDRAAAILALVGHPAVVLAEDREQPVELAEGLPRIEVARGAEGFVLRAIPPLREYPEGERGGDLGAEEMREKEALRRIHLVRESPKRLRLVRFTDARRRAAQLLAGGFRVPAGEREELQKTLEALAAHFEIEGEGARAAREIPAESRLRAELSPMGDDLLLRLVAAPLGPEGPRLPPGQGRSRLLAAVGGEPLGTRRDLAAEKRNLDAVLDAMPFLDEPEDGGAAWEWVLAEPESALAAIERLPSLPAVAALDWPKGRQLRVLPADPCRLRLKIGGDGDWLRLEGGLEAEEGLVAELGQLLAAAREKSRFIPMGEGVYLALSRRLKERLGDLAALAEAEGAAIRLPGLAAPWLEGALEGMAVQDEAGFREHLARLKAAQDKPVRLPRGLQAELRPYQEDGYRWAMGLAAAGFGACLADDMGLGKTLQTLAVLLARARGGPALVLAPTSVAGNWRAEAERFAPGLEVRAYGEGERDEILAGLGPGHVVIVSYTLLLMAQEKFAAIPWHTVVADEAQAIKNAEAKRSQAVFGLQADFRLALSGTPVENRLAELWSIMRFSNPGLLGSLDSFNERFAHPIEREGDRHAQQLLRRLVAPFILRRTKAQVLPELPPRTEQVFDIRLDSTEAAHYEALRRDALAEAEKALAAGAGEARFNILAQLTRLRRAACDPRLADPDFPGEGAKVQAFAELAAELADAGHKALVFSQFVDFLDLLRAALDRAGLAYQYLDGATPAAERSRRVAAFQAGEGDFFLISLKAGGFGLNLTAADYVVIADPWWNPAAEDQAMGRAHRLGQQRPVTVYRLVARGTVEERIVAMHQGKRALAEAVLAEGGEGMEMPSLEDLAALIRGAME